MMLALMVWNKTNHAAEDGVEERSIAGDGRDDDPGRGGLRSGGRGVALSRGLARLADTPRDRPFRPDGPET